MRYLAPRLTHDLPRKMVLLAGPRQSGKTTLAKSLLNARGQYLNWDIVRDRKVIRELAWPKDASLIVLDELHKAPKWKNLLKGVVDEFGNKPPVLVTREDLRDLSRVSSWRGPADLIELLRERVGKPTNYDNLAQNLGVSPPTSRAWVELLEKLYIVFLLPPFSSSLSRSIRKERRVYFFDCAAAYDTTGGAQLENLAACSLLKFVQFRKDAFGENWDVFYLRDKEGREVDFVVTHNRRVHWLIEVKTSDVEISRAMQYYSQKLKPAQSVQLVLNLDRPREKGGIKTLPLSQWLESLPFDLDRGSVPGAAT